MSMRSRSDAPHDMVDMARAFAAEKHRTQTRKYSGQPYTVHLDAVVEVLRSFDVISAEILAAAHLHDTVEDTDTTIQEIYDSFGNEVAEFVYWLTDAEQGKRKIRKIMSAWRLGRAPMDAKLIKMADLLDNTRDICRNDRHFAPVYLREARQILDSMVQAEGERLTRLPIFQEVDKLTRDSLEQFKSRPSRE